MTTSQKLPPIFTALHANQTAVVSDCEALALSISQLAVVALPGPQMKGHRRVGAAARLAAGLAVERPAAVAGPGADELQGRRRRRVLCRRLWLRPWPVARELVPVPLLDVRVLLPELDDGHQGEGYGDCCAQRWWRHFFLVRTLY